MPSNPYLADIPKSQVSRLMYIHWSLAWTSQAKTKAMQALFSISRYQANKDVALYRDVTGLELEYDSSIRAFASNAMKLQGNHWDYVYAAYDEVHASNLPLDLWIRTGIRRPLPPHSVATLTAISKAKKANLCLDVKGILASGKPLETKLFPLTSFGVDNTYYVLGTDVSAAKIVVYPIPSLEVLGEPHCTPVPYVTDKSEPDCLFLIKASTRYKKEGEGLISDLYLDGYKAIEVNAPKYAYDALKDSCGEMFHVIKN